MNSRGEILGIEGVMELLEGCSRKTPQDILCTLFSGVEAYARGQAQQDDRTAAVVRYL